MSRYVAFIVRMRFDEPGSGPQPAPVVRGSLQQVGSEELHYFDSFEAVAALLRQTTSLSIPRPAPGAEGAVD